MMVLKIFLSFFIFQYLKNKLWLPPHILLEIYKLLEKFNLFNSLDLLFIIFLLFTTLYFCFLLLNLMMTFPFFFWDGDMLRDHRDILYFLSRTAVCKPILLTNYLISLEELGRSQSFLFLNIELYPGMITPNQ